MQREMTMPARATVTAIAAAVCVAGSAGPEGPALLIAQSPAVAVLSVQGTVSMLTVSGTNIAVQIGKSGVLLVDAPPVEAVPAVIAEIRKLTDKPIRYIVNTNADADHMGGNAAVVSAVVGRDVRGAPMGALTGLGATVGRPAIIAHTNVLRRMSKAVPAPPAAALPTTEYFQPTMDFFNGEAIVLSHHQGHTDGDSLVFMRRSDVIATGDVFTPGRYPSIDLARGGSVQGLVRALTEILALAVPEAFAEGGTKIIPGHGRVSEETDVAEFRDMVVIVRDRVQDLMAKKMPLDQIKAARPSRDYDAEYGASPADADRFVESIYRSLAKPAGSGEKS
jgi:glyoxylase-like metal-dependent hydrolase (beta-lactamase superfamily II)